MAPCPNPVNGCSYCQAFLSYVGMKTLLVQLCTCAPIFSLCLLVDREPPSSLGGCAATAVLGGDSQGEMTQLVLSFLTGQNLQPLGHLCSLSLDLLRSVPSFLNCGDQNKDLNVKVSQCDSYLLIILDN